jgi:glycosyltransferase involved in cell wall biosynthesis
MKKRIFLVNDASFLNTGYAIYGKEILSRLHKNPDFEIAELGCFCDINNAQVKNIPWKFYANGVSGEDKRLQEYKANNLNKFGLWRFNRCVADFKPHIVFDIRDYWMFAYQENSPYKKYFHWVVMPATDSAPPKVEWMYTYNNADIVMPYTDWAKNVLSNYGGKNINLFPKIANAGINPNEFYPVENKQQHKISFFGRDVSIVGAVMRNQKRKLFPDIIISYRKYLDRIKESNPELYNKSYLYLHTSYPEDAGWDIPSLLLEYGLLDKTYFTYVCRQCKKFFPSKFQSPIQTCKHCANGVATVSSAAVGVDTEQLNQIYNFFDFFIQYAICEGFGMPQVEAAACGVPLASVDYSAMTEIVEKLGAYKIPVDRVFRELETNADRVYPDNKYTTNLLYDFFVNQTEEFRVSKSKEIRDKCISYYTWDNVYAVWEECFNTIDIRTKPSWTSKPIATTSHKTHKVPKNISNTEFVEYICHNIVNSPEILNTAIVQCLIRDLNNGIVAKDGSISPINRNQAIQILEGYLNNQISCEKMRTDPSTIIKEDFIK